MPAAGARPAAFNRRGSLRPKAHCPQYWHDPGEPPDRSRGQAGQKAVGRKGIGNHQKVYLAIIVDREAEMPVIIASSQGGMEIETVAREHPQAIFKMHVHPVTGLSSCHIRNLAFKLDLNKLQQQNFSRLLTNLYELFIKNDAALMEINPLIMTARPKCWPWTPRSILTTTPHTGHPEVWQALARCVEEEPLESGSLEVWPELYPTGWQRRLHGKWRRAGNGDYGYYQALRAGSRRIFLMLGAAPRRRKG